MSFEIKRDSALGKEMEVAKKRKRLSNLKRRMKSKRKRIKYYQKTKHVIK